MPLASLVINVVLNKGISNIKRNGRDLFALLKNIRFNLISQEKENSKSVDLQALIFSLEK